MMGTLRFAHHKRPSSRETLPLTRPRCFASIADAKHRRSFLKDGGRGRQCTLSHKGRGKEDEGDRLRLVAAFLAAGFEQEPGAALGLVDEDFE
jgi:hypothetical protein